MAHSAWSHQGFAGINSSTSSSIVLQGFPAAPVCTGLELLFTSKPLRVLVIVVDAGVVLLSTFSELKHRTQLVKRTDHFTTSSLNTMVTKRKQKSAYDDRMQADSLKKRNPGSWTSENGNELQTARPPQAGVSDEVAQEFQNTPNGNANIECPQVNFQNEISDPDECAKAANVTLTDRSCMGDPTYELDRPQHNVFDRGLTWNQKVYELVKCMDDLLQLIRLCPLRDTEHSMSMKGHTTEQNVTTVEDGHNTADDGETHDENRQEIKNTADHFTKHLDGLRTRAFAKKLGLRFLVVAGGTNEKDR